MFYKDYYNLVVRRCLLTKYMYTNVHQVLNFDSCILTISFSNDNIEEDMRVLYAFLVLELIGGHKTSIKRISTVYRAKTKNLVFVIKLCLYKTTLFDFIQLFSMLVIPNFRSRYVTRNFNVDPSSFGYSFAFRDLNVFPFLPEVYYK